MYNLVALGLLLALLTFYGACSNEGNMTSIIPNPSQDPVSTATNIPRRELDSDQLATKVVPSPTATHVPLPTANPAIKIPLTPIPTFDRGYPDVGDVNLVPLNPAGWDAPLIISSIPFSRIGQSRLSLSTESFVSMAVRNDGEDPVVLEFFVDLYLGELLLQRFPARGSLGPKQFFTWTDWSSLTDFVRLVPGPQTLRVVVDPTNLIRETDETDNTYELTVTWTGTPRNATGSISSRSPNLVAVVPKGWDDSVVATSYVGHTSKSGPLSVNVRTYIRYGFANKGLSSIPGRVLVDIYLDDTLVLRDSWSRVLAGSVIERQPWRDIQQVLYLTPGSHTLRIVLDPTNLIDETDESDNVFEKRFRWGTGRVPAKDFEDTDNPEIDPPKELTLPNLVPGWLWGWDGPIIVAGREKSHKDDRMTTSSSVYLDVVVFNQSIVEVKEPFEVELYFDGRLVKTFQMSAPTSRTSFRLIKDWSQLLESVAIEEGLHTLKLVIDPKNSVNEADETDNVFEKTVIWKDSWEALEDSTTYSNSELEEMLSDLPVMLDAGEPVRAHEGSDYSDEVLQIIDAGYYLTTGRSLKDEHLQILLLTREEYLEWIDDSYTEKFNVAEDIDYAGLLRSKKRDIKISTAKKERRFGKIVIVVDASREIGEVINSLAHEVGHMLQDVRNPDQSEAADSLELAAIKEAQAQQFERAFWLTIQDFTGVELLYYPAYDGFIGLIDAGVYALLQRVDRSEHALGRILQWQAVLDDPNLVALKRQLLSTGQLDAQASMTLFDYFVSLSPEETVDYVGQRLQTLPANVQKIVTIAKSRLGPDVGSGREGSPHLREPALLSP